MRTPRPGADINSFHSANNPLSWPQEGGSSRIQRSKSVVTRASRSDRVQRASAWEPGELLCAIVVGGLVCSIMAAFAVAIASRGSSGLVAALTTFVLSCGAGLVLVAVLDTSPGAKIVGVLCGTPCVVAPFVLLVLVATGVLDGSTDFDSAGACPQMLGDGWQQKPLQDLQFGLIRDSNSLWTANIGVKGASDATIASFRHVCPGGVFQLFSRYMQGGKNYELLIGEDTLLATVSSDTRPVGWELTVTDCRGNLVGAVTEPEANSLVISDATGREVGFVKGGSDGFEDDVELVDGVAQQIGVFGTQDGDPDTPVIMAQKAGIRGDTSTAWDLHVVNATHPAAEPLLLASVVAYKIWDGCDGSPWWTNDEDREPACHIRDSRCMEFWQSVFWFSTCVGCAALASACAAISTLACWSCRSCNSDNLSLGEAVRGGVLFGVGLALVVLLLKTIIESFLRDAVWTLCTTICLCCFFFGGGMSSGHVDNWTSDD